MAYLEGKALALLKFGLNLQPHVVVLTKDDKLSETMSYAVVSTKVYYETASIMEAVDIAYKSSFVLLVSLPEGVGLF